MSDSQNNTSALSLGEWAGRYAEWGWHVFPLRAGAKTPITAHGVKDATRDPAVIAQWWRRWPNANIGLATGEASGVVVIDPDGPAGLDEWRRIAGSPQTATVKTPGGGKHVYFRAIAGFRNKKIAANIDSRGDGGYVVLPPSVHPNGGRYAWEVEPEAGGIMDLPGFLALGPVTLIPHGNLEGKIDLAAMPTAPRDAMSAFDRCRRYLETLDPAISGQGGHNATFYAACTLYRFGLTESEAWELLAWFNGAKCQPAWSEKELRHKLRQARKQVDGDGTFGKKLEESDRPPDPVRLIHFPAAPEANEETSESPARFPADLLNPPGVVGELCRWMNSTAYKLQPILSLANSLAFFGAVVGRKVRTPTDLRSNLYCLGVGESGCGKDHSRKCVKRLCDAAGITSELLGGEEIASDSSILAAVHAHPTILFQLDEIGHMLSQANSKYAAAHMRNIAPTFMRLFSSANTTLIGKEYVGRARQDTSQPNVCLYGTTVPGRLFGGLSPAEISDGFLGRMLVFISDAPDPPETDQPAADVPDSLRIAIDEWWKRRDLPREHAGNLAGNCPITVAFDAEATAMFAAFAAECKRNKAASRDGNGLDSLWARAVEHARKVALVVGAGGDFAEPRVTATVAAWSVKLVGYLTRSLIEAVKDNISETDAGRTLQKIKRLIRSAGRRGLTKFQITKKTQDMMRRHRDEGLETLLEIGDVCRVQTATGKPGVVPTVYVASQFINSSSPKFDELTAPSPN